MSDHLEWMDQHPVLLRHITVQEVAQEEHYPMSATLKKLAQRFPGSEDYLNELARAGNFQEACTFLGYNLHPRATVWWGYRCVLDNLEELRQSPDKPRDIADIGKPRKLEVPDWAQMPKPQPDPQLQAALDKAVAQAQQHKEQVLAAMPAEARELFDQVMGIIDGAFKEQCGLDFQGFVDQACASIKEAAAKPTFDYESGPMAKAEQELREKIETARQKTIKLIKTVMPPKDEEDIRLQNEAALDVAYRCIVTPSDENAAQALEAGNQCPDRPQGMLALCAFWSYGILTPKQEVLVRTPPELLSGGMKTLMLQLGLARGGLYSYEERMQRYYDLGRNVARGADNWAESVEQGRAPHRNLNDAQPATEARVHTGVINRFRG